MRSHSKSKNRKNLLFGSNNWTAAEKAPKYRLYSIKISYFNFCCQINNLESCVQRMLKLGSKTNKIFPCPSSSQFFFCSRMNLLTNNSLNANVCESRTILGIFKNSHLHISCCLYRRQRDSIRQRTTSLGKEVYQQRQVNAIKQLKFICMHLVGRIF